MHKVVAYVCKTGRMGIGKLLVFVHRDYLEAGIQVPAGTVEEGEESTDALLRELSEEAGLTNCLIVRRLGAYQFIRPHDHEKVEREYFLLLAPAETAETWQHTVAGKGEDNGMVFSYSWANVGHPLRLAGDLGKYLTPHDVPELYRAIAR